MSYIGDSPQWRSHWREGGDLFPGIRMPGYMKSEHSYMSKETNRIILAEKGGLKSQRIKSRLERFAALETLGIILATQTA